MRNGYIDPDRDDEDVVLGVDEEYSVLPQVGSCDIFDLLTSEIHQRPPPAGYQEATDNNNSNCISNVPPRGQGRRFVDSSQTMLMREGADRSGRPGGDHHKNKGPLPQRQHETHRIAQKRRRDNLKQKIQGLQDLLPDSTKKDTASVLDGAIKRIQLLKNQLQWLKLQQSIPITPVFFPTIISPPPPQRVADQHN